ncbi:MAG: hypothetical protein DI556_20690 [Rhodovulum sulfidophilum]|uniref:MobA/VirD2-like nuclease domain-containing protein n=1 Tax=Rhodovulum sulfidophilum TaxID=35806 RepID=A0A2W5N6A8_RHOSU|nr:MAG: hypothetical protein DI556_20690 [Rhodovulum sulfidophilum]
MSEGPSVPALIRRGAQAPAHVDPLDAVMGEDWAALDLGRGGAARAQPSTRIGARRKRAALGGVLAPNPQSLVKLIGSGGAKNGRGLKAQMTYLSRQGAVPLRSSESTFGVELGAGDAAALAEAWGFPGAERGGADRTSHFVVSFPRDTDPEAAERAGRAWAAELFDGGAHGERWDYYTAFHTDTDYPHIHVVVSRRGLDEGRWLKISSRSEITFDRLREVQVEVAAREGIALSGTSRLSRGVHERPVPDAEYRRAQREGRAPVAPAHSAASARHAAAEVLAHARIYEGAAAAIRDADPEIARAIEHAAATLIEGRALLTETSATSERTTEEALAMARSIEDKQEQVQRNFRTLDARLGELPLERRGEIARRIAGLKAEAAPLIRDDLALQTYRAETPHPDYRGLEVAAGDAGAVAIKAEADRAVADLARRHDLGLETTSARHAAGAVSLGLGRDYRALELAERAASRAARGEVPEAPERAEAELDAFHRAARTIYREAAERLRMLERAREEPAREQGEAPAPTREAEIRDAAARRARDRDDDERGR